MKSLSLSSAALVAAALLHTAVSQPLNEVLARENNTLSTLNALLQKQPQLVSSLTSARNITVIAPNNDAFNELLQNQNVAGRVNSDPSFVRDLLMYHVINGTFRSSNFSTEPTFAKTLLTNPASTNVTGGQVVNVQSNNNTVTIANAYKAVAQVVKADVEFDGGVVHVVDSVLEIPRSLVDTTTQANLTDLQAALTRANLVNTLAQSRDITVFAPNNAAFQAIASTAQNLSVEDLQSVLSYHVVPGVAYSTIITNGTVKSLEGSNLNLTVEDNGSIFVNGVHVVTPDVLIKNGVLHIVDTVLMSKDDSGNDNSTSSNPTSTSGGGGSSGATGTSTSGGSSSPTGSAASASTKASAFMALTIAFGIVAMFMNGM
ncbi:hypothetical protein HIM_10288 [Hirsutella minnesotensis 3608]|uniref:FAS1 domain-containing protein n=1 Tax=Hirsutella minnesotensis 3608 TaxID=1043627 RepID=A0A0F7ZK89_9HYPO|nr:hypothetical protein HIM_12396 [Hirsutella minnesotensis 3608]KJZ70320.1 hypothetical protein HIM_10288 [Hirsutella minnesotensis 3608]